MATSKLLAGIKSSVKNEKVIDQTIDTGGGFERIVTPKGTYPSRLVGYVEVGLRKGGSYQGKDKPDYQQAWLFFELLGKKLAREIGEGDEKRTIYPVHLERIAIKNGDRANFTKLLKKMDYGRGNTHMGLMLGEGFRVGIVHKVDAKDDKKIWANIKNDEGYLVSGPFVEVVDDETGESTTKKVRVPEQTVAERALLWDDPTMDQWESIFIDGSYTKKADDGTEEEVSKNYIQEACLSAEDFEGSPLQALLASQEMTLPDTIDDDGEDDVIDDGDDVVDGETQEDEFADLDLE